MQLDADDGSDPFYRPPIPPAAAEASKSDDPNSRSVGRGENDVESAATATIEQEA